MKDHHSFSCSRTPSFFLPGLYSVSLVLQYAASQSYVLAFVHVTLVFVFLTRLSTQKVAMDMIGSECPWELLAHFLEELLDSYDKPPNRIEDDKFHYQRVGITGHWPKIYLAWTFVG